MSQKLKYVDTHDIDVHSLDTHTDRQDVSVVLANPVLAKKCLGQYALIGIVREYVSMFDSTTKAVYLYYLMGKNSLETSRLMGITNGHALRSLSSLIDGFNQYAIERLKEDGINIEKAEKYVENMCLDTKMDDDQIAEVFYEDMLTTKIMKHFVRKAGMVRNVLCGFFSLCVLKTILSFT